MNAADLDSVPPDAWSGPTTAFWQRLERPEDWVDRMAPPYRYAYPARLPDGRILALPVRRITATSPSAPIPVALQARADHARTDQARTDAPIQPPTSARPAAQPGSPQRATASLIANQAAFEVVDALAEAMTPLARMLSPDVVVGLPTLGMVFAPPVARALGHERWVPLGYSRKFWYDETWSTEVASITTPGPGKRIYLDPNQLTLLRGRRAVIVDDAISSGRTVAQVWDLLARLDVDVAGVVVAMRQGPAWRAALGANRASRILGVFDAPLLRLAADGWWPE